MEKLNSGRAATAFCRAARVYLAPKPASRSLANNAGSMGSTNRNGTLGHSGNVVYVYKLPTAKTI